MVKKYLYDGSRRKGAKEHAKQRWLRRLVSEGSRGKAALNRKVGTGGSRWVSADLLHSVFDASCGKGATNRKVGNGWSESSSHGCSCGKDQLSVSKLHASTRNKS